MAIVDADSPGFYLLIVLILTTFAMIAKFLYFNFAWFYTVKTMIFNVFKYVSVQAYGIGDQILKTAEAAGNNNCSTNFDIDPDLNPDLANDIKQNFDSYAMNLAEYVDKNKDSDARLSILSAESERFVNFSNYLEVIKFFILIGCSVAMILIIMRLKYDRWLSPFSFISNKSRQ